MKTTKFTSKNTITVVFIILFIVIAAYTYRAEYFLKHGISPKRITTSSPPDMK